MLNERAGKNRLTNEQVVAEVEQARQNIDAMFRNGEAVSARYIADIMDVSLKDVVDTIERMDDGGAGEECFWFGTRVDVDSNGVVDVVLDYQVSPLGLVCLLAELPSSKVDFYKEAIINTYNSMEAELDL